LSCAAGKYIYPAGSPNRVAGKGATPTGKPFDLAGRVMLLAGDLNGAQE